MKTTFVVLLAVFATSAFAQDQAAPSPTAACGPASAQFDSQKGEKQALSQPVDGKGQVYVVEVFEKVVGELAHPTLRVGMDGQWVGADKGNSYLTFPVGPGEHHLCTNWQSHFRRFSKQAAFAGFNAEAGKNYYFRAKIVEHGGATGGSTFSLDLDQVNEDEGKYLVASSASSISQLKK
jgi:hypothetical protein